MYKNWYISCFYEIKGVIYKIKIDYIKINYFLIVLKLSQNLHWMPISCLLPIDSFSQSTHIIVHFKYSVKIYLAEKEPNVGFIVFWKC